jgi:hypothetical protein
MATQPTPVPVDPAVEADNLAKLFYSMSDAVDEFRLSTPEITPADQARLRKQAQDLDDRAHQFTAQAVGARVAALIPNLLPIKTATTEVLGQFAKLNSVAKAIALGDAVLALGIAASTGDVTAIVTALTGVTQAMS